jgi:hypothetical protein
MTAAPQTPACKPTGQRGWHWLESVVRRAVCGITGHWWTDTRVNAFQIGIEQRCDCCRRYQHHYLRDALPLNGNIRWRDGQMPRTVSNLPVTPNAEVSDRPSNERTT